MSYLFGNGGVYYGVSRKASMLCELDKAVSANMLCEFAR